MFNTNLEIAQQYVALFGRAPDAEGLGFWAGQRDAGQTLVQMADAMFGTAPARAYFPEGLTNEQLIASFYFNVLGRQTDAGGLAFWTAKLNAQGAMAGLVIAEMVGVVASYAGTDPAGLGSAALFNNRVAVAQSYGEHGGLLPRATAVLAGVTSDLATVGAAKTLVLSPGAAGVYDAAGYAEIELGALSGDVSLIQIGAGTGLTITESTGDWYVGASLANSSGGDDFVPVTLKGAAIFVPKLWFAGVEHLTFVNIDVPDPYSYTSHSVSLADVRYADHSPVGTYKSVAVAGSTPFHFDASISGIVTGSSDDDNIAIHNSRRDVVSAGAGNDIIDAGSGQDTLTGGPGGDTFRLTPNADGETFPTITDFSVEHDRSIGWYDALDAHALNSHNTVVWTPSRLEVPQSASFRDCLNAASKFDTSWQSVYSWLQYSGDTYIIVDNSAATTFQDGADQVVKLAGLIDLSGITLHGTFFLF